MVYLNHEVAAQSPNVSDVKSTALSKAYGAYATPHPQNSQSHKNRQTSNPQINASTNGDANRNGNVKPLTDSAAEAVAVAAAAAAKAATRVPLPSLYNYRVSPSQAPTVEPHSSTNFEQQQQQQQHQHQHQHQQQQQPAQAMFIKNVSPRPYVPPPNTHMDLSNFHSRPLYSTKDLAFQPISKFFDICVFGEEGISP